MKGGYPKLVHDWFLLVTTPFRAGTDGVEAGSSHGIWRRRRDAVSMYLELQGEKGGYWPARDPGR
jgi:hypothetical protein